MANCGKILFYILILIIFFRYETTVRFDVYACLDCNCWKRITVDCSRQIATVIYILNVFNSNGLGQFSFEVKNVEFHELSFFMYNVLFTASVCCVPSQTPIYRVVQTTTGHWLIYLLGKLTSLNQWVPIDCCCCIV